VTTSCITWPDAYFTQKSIRVLHLHSCCTCCVHTLETTCQ
jgi:hypothetical protein